MSERKFRLLVEGYVKRNVDYELFLSLDESGVERFIEKFTIGLCREYSPKSRYGISKGEVRGIFIDVFDRLNEPWCVDLKYLYSYKTIFSEYRLVYARTKKQAFETADLIKSSPMDELGVKKSMQKVAKLLPDRVITVNGEERPILPFMHLINVTETEDCPHE